MGGRPGVNRVPGISTGVYGFPKERAARIAFETVTREAPIHVTLERIVFCSYSEGDARVYRGLLATAAGD